MSEDVAFLRDVFNVYYEKAKVAHASGNIELAKRNYLLAAETLFKIAKGSSPQLRKAQYDRAVRLTDIAESLDGNYRRPLQTKARPSSSIKNDDTNRNSEKEEQKEEGKDWVGAEIPNMRFSDIAGLDEVKKTIITRMINPVKYPDKYAKYDKKIGGGVLLYGPPGTGKTMIAKAIAGEVGATFYAIKGSDILSKWVGESEQNINSLFEAAKKDKLAIIFIDEMDSLFGSRGKDIHNDKRVNEFLQQIDGFATQKDNLLLLGATNRPWDVDSAAVRSGRFSEKIYVTLPDEKAREFLLRKHLEKCPLDSNIDWDKLVKFTKGYSGADIAEVCDRAKEDPLTKYVETNIEVPVSMIHILEAIKKVPPTVREKDLKPFEDYAGIKHEDIDNHSVTDDSVMREYLEATKRDDEKHPVTVVFANKTIALHDGVKPKLEFSLSKNFDKIYVNIAGYNYVCSKVINNWETEPLNIDKPGEYEVVILDNNEITRERIKFTKGLEEEDLGL